MTETYKEYLPLNARVIVDYTKEQKVTFSYPVEMTYEKAVWKRGFQIILSFWLALHGYVLNILLPFFLLFFFGFLMYLGFEGTHTITSVTGGWKNSLLCMGLLIVCLVYIFGIPAMFNYFASKRKEFYAGLIPKMGYWKSKMSPVVNEKEFIPIDVIENVVVIPQFNNVYLHYEADGEFNEYLEKIEIWELPFNLRIKIHPLMGWWVKPLLSIKDGEKNSFEFRAVFHFKQKPMNGKLVVTYE